MDGFEIIKGKIVPLENKKDMYDIYYENKEGKVINSSQFENINVSFNNLVFKEKKLNNVLKLLDNLIKNHLSKKQLTENQISFFYKNYNGFKMAIGYLKQIDKKEGKKYAKDFLKMIGNYLK